MELLDQLSACACCRFCEGAAYQAPPALYLGSSKAPIIVIAQNPGELHPKDSFRVEMCKMMNEYVNNATKGADVDPNAILAWYSADFSISPAYTKMVQVFGETWIKDGQILYTNAVRCRTPHNDTPSSQMKETCMTWTRILAYRQSVKAIVFIGKFAVDQFLGDKASKLPVNVIKRHGESGKLLLALPHYVTWKSEDVPSYRETFDRLTKTIGG